DQHEILSHGQRQLPRVYLEHDPPREHPTDTRHIAADDANVVIVHVTPFNALMWDNGQAATRTIEHGVPNRSDLHYSGELDRGIVVVNNIAARGRRTGLDVFERIREQVPLDLAGMGSEQLGGLGDVPREQLLQMMGRYRFLFNPIRYTSLGLAVCEAMMLGMPIVGLATTEMPTVVENDASGYVDTDVDRLVQHMQTLLADPAKARALGAEARRTAIRRFGMERFAHEWSDIFQQTVDRTRIARQAV
ncbi:MAG: glycosyltransferase family 4 protein, partial [Dehalococcoidia bacterium]